jgi:hypothetical protein
VARRREPLARELLAVASKGDGLDLGPAEIDPDPHGGEILCLGVPIESAR